MQLTQYLRQYRIPTAEFAGRIGIARQAVYLYLTGKRDPEWAVMVEIEAKTKGKVTPNDWLRRRKRQRKREQTNGGAIDHPNP